MRWYMRVGARKKIKKACEKFPHRDACNKKELWCLKNKIFFKKRKEKMIWKNKKKIVCVVCKNYSFYFYYQSTNASYNASVGLMKKVIESSFWLLSHFNQQEHGFCLVPYARPSACGVFICNNYNKNVWEHDNIQWFEIGSMNIHSKSFREYDWEHEWFNVGA